MPSAESYCVRCRKKTPDSNPHIVTVSGRGGSQRKMKKSTCSVCGCTKCQFVSSKAGKAGDGLFDSIGDFFSKPSNVLSTASLPVSMIPIIGKPASIGLAGGSQIAKLLGHGVGKSGGRASGRAGKRWIFDP